MSEPDAFIADLQRQEPLTQLPLRYRWEFVRRHPVYLACWRLAAAHLKGEIACEGPTEQSIAYAALLLVQTIGVTGEPVDPSTPFEVLDSGNTVTPEFLPGPVQPMTYRSMLHHQIMALPREELACIAALFQVASDREAVHSDIGSEIAGVIQRQKASAELMRLISPVLDSFPEAPLCYIDPTVSGRVIGEATQRISRLWKARRNIPEKRLQVRHFDEALAVWDLREGWNEGSYCVELCQSYRKILRSQKVPKTTLINRYRTAFSWIIGRPYSWETWARLFDAILSPRATMSPSNVYVARFLRATNPANHRTDASAPEDQLQSLGTYADVVQPDVESTDFLIDLKDLIEQGRSDDQIAHILQAPIELISHYRSHCDEFDMMDVDLT